MKDDRGELDLTKQIDELHATIAGFQHLVSVQKLEITQLTSIQEVLNMVTEGNTLSYLTKDLGNAVKIHETEKLGLSMITTKRRSENIKKNICENSHTRKKVLSFLESNRKYDFIKDCNLLDNITFKPGTAKNDVVIVNSTIQELCSNIVKTKTKLQEQIQVVFTDFINKFQEHTNKLREIVTYVTALDLIITKAYIAKWK